MNSFTYDELYQKYLNLLKENACLKAKLKQIEAESGSLNTLLELYQTQELMFEKAQKLEPDNQIQEDLIIPDFICTKPVHHLYETPKPKRPKYTIGITFPVIPFFQN